MKKGFTLIEVLAVIVILAIIALIATPIVLGIISDARNEAKVRSAELYLTAVEQAILRKKMNDITFNPDSCEIDEAGVMTCEVNGEKQPLQVEVDGTLPTSGTITLSNGKVISHTLVIDDSTIVNGVIQDTQVPDEPEEIVVSLGDTYTLKNGDEKYVIATNESISTFAISSDLGQEYNEDYVVVLKDGSEWYLIESTTASLDTVRLISKYNYYVEGTNKGEMDPSDALNPMVATSEIKKEPILDCMCWESDNEGNCTDERCDDTGFVNCSYDQNFIEPFVDEIIKPKLLSSLGLNELNVYLPETFSVDYGHHYDEFSQSFWLKITQEYEMLCDPYIPSKSGDAGVRVEITIDKSYISAILSEYKYYYDEDLMIYYKLPDIEKLNFKKAKETDSETIYISKIDFEVDPYEYLGIYDIYTNDYIGGYEYASFIAERLGYPSDGCDADLTNDIEGVDNNIAREILGTNPSCAEFEFPKNAYVIIPKNR